LASAAQGGLELGLLTLAAVSEELGRSAAPSASIRNALAAWLIAEFGDDAQRATWLDPLLNGAVRAAFAPGDITFADGVLSGVAAHVEGANSADLFIVGVADQQLALAPASDAIEI